jgi:hypothetical protein
MPNNLPSYLQDIELVPTTHPAQFKAWLAANAQNKNLESKPCNCNHQSPNPCICYAYIYEDQNRFFYLLESEYKALDDANPLKNKCTKIDYTSYQQAINNQFRVVPRIEQSDNLINGFVSDGGWQTACALTAGLAAEYSSCNISTQLGFPIVGGIIGGVLRYRSAMNRFEKAHGRLPTDQEKEVINKDCFAFTFKTMAAMGAWELGFFVAKTVITTCSAITPIPLLVPAVLAIGAGIFMGLSAVAAQITDENRKFGKTVSSPLSLAGTFVTTFLCGAAWQLCSYIPFGSLLAKTVLKPAATIAADILVGIATGIATFLINELAPKMYSAMGRLFSPKKERVIPNIQGDDLSRPLLASLG